MIAVEHERRIVLDEVEPAMRRNAERNGGVGLVLRDIDAQQRRAVHPAERLLHAGFVDDGDDHRHADLGRLGLGGAEDIARRPRRRWRIW